MPGAGRLSDKTTVVPVGPAASLTLAFPALWLGLSLANARGPTIAPGRPEIVSIREAKQRLTAAPDSRPQCVLRGTVTLPQGTLPSLPGAFYFQDETSGISEEGRTRRPCSSVIAWRSRAGCI